MRTVNTNVPGGLGFTYPNPIQLRDKLWLFWRGGGWNPTFSYTEDGRTGCRPASSCTSAAAQRPYAKYVGDGNRRIHGIFTNGNAQHVKNSLTTCATKPGSSSRERAPARHTGSTCRCTSPSSTTSTATPPAGGRAWPHDIALTAEGRPRIVYTRRVATRTPSTTPTTTANGGSAARSSRPDAGRELLPLRRRDARPRGPALRLPLANDRPLESGRAVVHAGLRPDLADPAAHPTTHGFSMRPVTPRGRAQPRPLLGRRAHARLHDYTTRIHALDF